MAVELRINGSSTVFQDYGVKMGDDFIDTLTEPLTLKEHIENESRLEHGKRVVVDDNPKFASARSCLTSPLLARIKPISRQKRMRFWLKCIRAQ